jgi:hypothetical protein
MQRAEQRGASLLGTGRELRDYDSLLSSASETRIVAELQEKTRRRAGLQLFVTSGANSDACSTDRSRRKAHDRSGLNQATREQRKTEKERLVLSRSLY